MVAYKNGQAFEIPDPTAEELAYWEQEAAQQPAPEPTPEERIAALEEELAATKILLGLEA